MSHISPESPIPITVDATVGDMPAWLTEGYVEKNQYIANDNARYGGTIQAEHINLSHGAIAATAVLALERAPKGEDRTALILGPGGCFDIPLQAIVTEFDRTTLVEVDAASTEEVLSTLPSRLLKKVNLVNADITGGIAPLSKVFENAKMAQLTFKEFIGIAAEAVGELTNRPASPPVEGKYSFACSQLLMSQLVGIPQLQFYNYVQQTYDRSLSRGPGYEDEALVFALNEYNLRTQTSHIDHLAQLITKSGTVHFADTLVEIKPGGDMLPMTNSKVLDQIKEHFTETRPQEGWNWRATPKLVFHVGAWSLALKQASVES